MAKQIKFEEGLELSLNNLKVVELKPAIAKFEEQHTPLHILEVHWPGLDWYVKPEEDK